RNRKPAAWRGAADGGISAGGSSTGRGPGAHAAFYRTRAAAGPSQNPARPRIARYCHIGNRRGTGRSQSRCKGRKERIRKDLSAIAPFGGPGRDTRGTKA